MSDTFLHNPVPKGRLVVEAPHDAAELVILDGALNRVARTVERFEADVPAGIYRISARLGNMAMHELREVIPTRETFVRREDWGPGFSRDVPLVGTSIPFELRQRRVIQEAIQRKSKLAIFGQQIDHSQEQDSESYSFWSSLSLRDAGGSAIKRFQRDEITDNNNRYMVATHDIPYGGLRLNFTLDIGNKPHKVEMPLWISPNRQTQLFATWSNTSATPMFAICMPEIDDVLTALDAQTQRDAEVTQLALQGLQRGKSLLPSADRAALLEGKFRDAWLGIVGAHCMLLEPDLNWEQMTAVVHSLEATLGAHPDVLALKLACGERDIRLTFPPMLRASLSYVARSASEQEQLIPTGSLLEFVTLRSMGYGPWTVWQVDDLQTTALYNLYTKTARRIIEPSASRELGIPNANLVASETASHINSPLRAERISEALLQWASDGGAIADRDASRRRLEELFSNGLPALATR